MVESLFYYSFTLHISHTDICKVFIPWEYIPDDDYDDDNDEDNNLLKVKTAVRLLVWTKCAVQTMRLLALSNNGSKPTENNSHKCRTHSKHLIIIKLTKQVCLQENITVGLKFSASENFQFWIPTVISCLKSSLD